MLNGLPTFFLILILAACVKYLYLKPLEKVLAERYRLTEGARQAADESLKNADSKIAEYEDALAKARGDIYKEHAEFLRKVNEEQADQIRKVRADSDHRISTAKLAISEEARIATEGLEGQSETLAAQIADAVLARRVA